MQGGECGPYYEEKDTVVLGKMGEGETAKLPPQTGDRFLEQGTRLEKAGCASPLPRPPRPPSQAAVSVCDCHPRVEVMLSPSTYFPPLGEESCMPSRAPLGSSLPHCPCLPFLPRGDVRISKPEERSPGPPPRGFDGRDSRLGQDDLQTIHGPGPLPELSPSLLVGWPPHHRGS